MLCKSLRLVPAFKCSTKQGQRRQHKLRNRLGSSMLILLFPLWVITDHRADQLCLHPKINTLVVVFFALKACPRWVLYEKWGMDSGGNDTIACSLKTLHKIQARNSSESHVFCGELSSHQVGYFWSVREVCFSSLQLCLANLILSSNAQCDAANQ